MRYIKRFRNNTHPRIKIRKRNWVKAMTLSKQIAPGVISVHGWGIDGVSGSYGFDDIPDHLKEQGWKYYGREWMEED